VKIALLIKGFFYRLVRRKEMKYTVTQELLYLIPGKALDAQPLEFDWEEATNAILFTSNLQVKDFCEWNLFIEKHLRSCLPKTASIKVETDEEIFCTSFWISLTKDIHEYIDPDFDLHVAWGNHDESFENLNSWIGSELFEEMVSKKDIPATAGLIRVRP
jgi:hypothetical protein